MIIEACHHVDLSEKHVQFDALVSRAAHDLFQVHRIKTGIFVASTFIDFVRKFSYYSVPRKMPSSTALSVFVLMSSFTSLDLAFARQHIPSTLLGGTITDALIPRLGPHAGLTAFDFTLDLHRLRSRQGTCEVGFNRCEGSSGKYSNVDAIQGSCSP